MPLFRPSELKEFLLSLGVRPQKRMSQNFLIDGNILQKIATLADLKAGDLVVEIGSGPGALTELLLEKGCKVIAIEKDLVFAKALHRLKQDDRLQVIESDVLEVDFHSYITQKAKVVANIPYHLTSPIMEKLFSSSSLFSKVVLMVQEEVARRCVAQPHSKDFSSFSIFLQFYAAVRYGFFVSRNCFYPAPNVDSAVICLDIKEKLPLEHPDPFFQMVRKAFSQRRKMLTSSLKGLVSQEAILKALHELKKSPKTRPEELSLQEWIDFVKIIY
jgi:16S rRNA (adenine1518-N6/adenine1519-N6)-dimethyltransferase